MRRTARWPRGAGGTAAGAAVGAGGAAAAMAGVAAGLTDVAPYLAAGTGAQVLLGALSYLLPVQLGRGPASVKAANARVDRGAVFRVATANVMLLLCAAPVPSWVRVIASVVFLAVLLAFVPLAASAARAARAAAHTRTAPPRSTILSIASWVTTKDGKTVSLSMTRGCQAPPTICRIRFRARLTPA